MTPTVTPMTPTVTPMTPRVTPMTPATAPAIELMLDESQHPNAIGPANMIAVTTANTDRD